MTSGGIWTRTNRAEVKTREAAVTGRLGEVSHVVGNFIAEAVLGHSDTDDRTAKLRTKMRVGHREKAGGRGHYCHACGLVRHARLKAAFSSSR